VHFLARVHNNHVEGEDGLGFDGAFIASARTDVPALVAEVRRLRERLDASNAVFEQLVELLLRHLNDTPTVDDDDEP
jgi:CRP-like cAMP-binding protein